MKKPMLYTAFGGMQVIYLHEFIELIPTQNVEAGVIHYAKIPQFQVATLFNGDFSPNSTTITQHTAVLKPYSSISRLDYMSNVNLKDTVRNSMLKYLSDELKTMTAQKIPKFFIKDLNMESLNKLSMEFVKQGSESDYGLHIDLSESQKFFIIADPKDFCFYYHTYEDYSRDSTIFAGKLVHLKDRNFIMGRYEHLKYLKELSAMRIYTIDSDSKV